MKKLSKSADAIHSLAAQMSDIKCEIWSQMYSAIRRKVGRGKSAVAEPFVVKVDKSGEVLFGDRDETDFLPAENFSDEEMENVYNTLCGEIPDYRYPLTGFYCERL